MRASLQFDHHKARGLGSALCTGVLVASLAFASSSFAAGGGGGGGGWGWGWGWAVGAVEAVAQGAVAVAALHPITG